MAIFNCTKINMRNGSKDITTLQQELKKMGYYTRKLDTSYGYYTKQAVKSFQKKYGLVVDGIFGQITCKKFNEVIESTNTTNNTSTTNVSTTSIFNCPKISLKQGSTGADVTTLQTYLKKLNYYTRQVDGDYGLYTEKAVTQFQSAQKLKVDGWFAQETCKKLTQVVVSKKIDNANTTTTKTGGTVSTIPEYAKQMNCKLIVYPTVVVLPESVETEGKQTVTGGSTSSDTNFDCTKINLRRGSGNNSADVTKLQTILKARGYYTRQIDGEFGKYTENAVKKLQSAQGNTPDGWFGQKTCQKLQGTSTTSNNATNTTDKKAGNYVITDIKSHPSITDDMDAMSHDITLQTPFSSEKMAHIRKLQKTHFELLKDKDIMYTHDGYINEIKMIQSDSTYLIEIQIVGYTVFLDTTVSFEKTAKRSELIKELCACAGLKLKIDTTGFEDSEYTIKVQKATTSSSSEGLTQLSGQDCTGAMQTAQLSAYSYDINKCGGNTKIGNSNANYAKDTAGMSAKEAVMDVYNRFKYGVSLTSSTPYDDNRRCPQVMWQKTGKIFGNCADISRLIKCVGEVHGLKVGIRHTTHHYYNLIEVNGKTYLFDCCFKGGTTGSRYGGEACNTLSMRGGPWS